jgi:hypothetical protein
MTPHIARRIPQHVLMPCCADMLQIVIGGRDKYSINGHAAQQG